jgi:histidinol phosphatase-like enzyme
MYWQQHKDNNVELLNIRKPGSRGKLSENTINKIKDKRKTFRHTEESKNKMRKPRPNMVGKATKSILCLNNNIIYPSVSKAALNLGLKQGDISNVLTNRQNSTKGYKFVYGK